MPDDRLNHLVTLSMTEAIPMVGRACYDSPDHWYLSADYMSHYFTTVTYIAEVRMRGGVWRGDSKGLIAF
jgi:hypothetical protein